MPLRIRAVAWDDEAAVLLRDDQRAEIRSLYGGVDTEPGSAPTGDDVLTFLVAYDGGEAVGCGGLRRLGDALGEIKRMYVVPARRGRGVSTAILAALERRARGHGWTRLVLETGAAQLAAIGFYEREGYRPIERFGHYVHSEISRCYGKDLGGAAP